MGDKPLCDRLRASGSALELEAAEAISHLGAHAITLEAEAATWRQMLTQAKAENAQLRDALRLEEEARQARAQRWTGPEPAIDSDPWAV